MENKKCCYNCKKDSIFNRCSILLDNEDYKRLLQTAAASKNIEEYDARFCEEPYNFTKNYVCEEYKSKYIEYPIEVSKINTEDKQVEWREKDKGKFVRIRPCNEKYGNKTYLGIYLGELHTGSLVRHDPETKELHISSKLNPAIFVFELNEIIFGYESWWGIIKNEEQLKEISDIDIDNVWYVKALESLDKKS